MKNLSFPFFKKKKQEEQKGMTTLEQIQKAYEDLSDDDKKSFQQSLSDRVHESIAAQERADGDEDSQSAEAREHEALGEEHADGKGETEELHEQDDTAEEKREDKHDDDKYSSLMARLDALEARLEKRGDSDAEAAEKAEEVYGLGNGVFAAAKQNDKAITPQEAASVVRRFK